MLSLIFRARGSSCSALNKNQMRLWAHRRFPRRAALFFSSYKMLAQQLLHFLSRERLTLYRHHVFITPQRLRSLSKG
jgi:hypothetical protein